MEIEEEARKIVEGARREKYDGPERNFDRTAKIWSGILNTEVTPKQVALCMVGLKLAREAHKGYRDNRVDGVGYFLCADILSEPPRPKKRYMKCAVCKWVVEGGAVFVDSCPERSKGFTKPSAHFWIEVDENGKRIEK